MAPTVQGAGNQNWYAGLMVAAVVGGTASELGGGKFEDGAITGSFYYMFEGNMPTSKELAPREF